MSVSGQIVSVSGQRVLISVSQCQLMSLIGQRVSVSVSQRNGSKWSKSVSKF